MCRANSGGRSSRREGVDVAGGGSRVCWNGENWMRDSHGCPAVSVVLPPVRNICQNNSIWGLVMAPLGHSYLTTPALTRASGVIVSRY